MPRAIEQPPAPIPIIYFPRRGDQPPDPVPYVLTEADLIRFTRLDETDVKNPSTTVARYREQGKLRFVQVGRDYRYTLPDALRFIATLQGVSSV